MILVLGRHAVARGVARQLLRSSPQGAGSPQILG
jgi:hypothetical protein